MYTYFLIFSSICCVVFARTMYYTSKFAMAVLGKCATHVSSTR